MVGREAHQEDEDGAAHQLPDAALLVRLRASAAAHGAQDAQVAHLHTEMTVTVRILAQCA